MTKVFASYRTHESHAKTKEPHDYHEAEKVLLHVVQDMGESIKLLLQAGRTVPALVLVYAAIDMMASLSRPKNQPDTSGEYFRRWVTTYMLAGSLGITADDLWGARAGLLHTRTADSTWSRKGKARQICYSRGQDGTTKARTQRALSLNSDRVFVDVDELCKTYAQGVSRFVKEMMANRLVYETAMHHLPQMFASISSGATDS